MRSCQGGDGGNWWHTAIVDDSAVGTQHAALVERIAAAAAACTPPRDPAEIQVMAVTKGFDGSAIEAAFECGLRTIGESYAQDLLGKRDVVEALRPQGLSVWFIGRLQTNKVRQVADIVDVYASVDRPSLVNELAKRAAGATVLIQVNATGEPQKGGCPPADVAGLVEEARRAGLDVIGLMAMGPTDAPPAAAAPVFATVVALADELGLPVRSLGMSGDLEVAVAAGSTQVRVGSALFGPRPPR